MIGKIRVTGPKGFTGGIVWLDGKDFLWKSPVRVLASFVNLYAPLFDKKEESGPDRPAFGFFLEAVSSLRKRFPSYKIEILTKRRKSTQIMVY